MWDVLVIVALVLVVLALLAGLINMFRGGSPNASQRLMRARVILQAIAIAVVMAALYFSQSGDG